MNTLYLKYVLEVEQTGSISHAAQNLFMAQPNLSKAIKDFERELGYSIFERTPSGVTVTEKGTEFLYHARKMMEQMVEIEKISRKMDMHSKQFKLSIPRGSYIASGVTAFVAEMQQAEEMDITINETNSLHTISNVADRGYNMGIIRYPLAEEELFKARLEKKKLKYETLWEFEYVLVMSKTHPLAEREKICVEDLHNYTEITHGDSDMSHTQSEEEEERTASRTIYIYERGSQFDLLANVPNTYMWVSAIPNIYLEKFGLVQRICKAKCNRYKDVLIYREDYKLDEYDKLFQKKIYDSKVDVASAKYS